VRSTGRTVLDVSLKGVHKPYALAKNVKRGNAREGPSLASVASATRVGLEHAPAVTTKTLIPARCFATAGVARRLGRLPQTAAGVSENPREARSARVESRGV